VADGETLRELADAVIYHALPALRAGFLRKGQFGPGGRGIYVSQLQCVGVAELLRKGQAFRGSRSAESAPCLGAVCASPRP
jgi:hypothetical protein